MYFYNVPFNKLQLFEIKNLYNARNCIYRFFLRSAKFIDTPMPNFRNWINQFYQVLSLQELFFSIYLLFSTMTCLGEKHRYICFGHSYSLPNFRNKQSIITRGCLCNNFYGVQLYIFLDTPAPNFRNKINNVLRGVYKKNISFLLRPVVWEKRLGWSDFGCYDI